jgi:hypothetical protein
MSGTALKTYRVTVDAMDDGRACHLGVITVDAPSEEAARQQGYDDLWDSRLDILSCGARVEVQELDVDVI